MSEEVEMIIAGSVGLAVGALAIIFKNWLARFFADLLLAFFGRASASAVRRSTPSRTAFSGACAIFIGGALIAVAIVR